MLNYKKPRFWMIIFPIFMVLVVTVAVGCTFTGAKGIGTSGPDMGNAYAIPLDDISFYGPHGIQTEPAVGKSDIAEILAEAESGGIKMLFYRTLSGDIWGAWENAEGSVYRFIHAYDAQEEWGYETGFSIEPFQNLFRRDGFVMGYSLGASYHPYDYYFFNDGGDVELLANCTNNHTILDLDGDGNAELLYFSYVSTGLRPIFYLQRENGLYEVDVTALLYDTFLGWSNIQSDGSVSQDKQGPYLPLTFCMGEDKAEYSCRVRYTGNALMVENIHCVPLHIGFDAFLKEQLAVYMLASPFALVHFCFSSKMF